MDLTGFFLKYPKVAIAFSGGVDSAYLLYAAKKYAKSVQAYYVKSAFQPQFELDDANRLASELSVQLKVIDVDVLSDESITSNPENRCYFCKKRIFAAIRDEAKKDGFLILLDGTNASDDASDRPGVKALLEYEVLSPLRICGLKKNEIRQLSQDAGLFTWDKPAYACLATRIKSGEEITAEKLEATERSEAFLSSLGFSDFRVRRVGDMAKLQVPYNQIDMVVSKREMVVSELKKYYSDVCLDLEVR